MRILIVGKNVCGNKKGEWSIYIISVRAQTQTQPRDLDVTVVISHSTSATVSYKP